MWGVCLPIACLQTLVIVLDRPFRVMGARSVPELLPCKTVRDEIEDLRGRRGQHDSVLLRGP